MEELKKIFKKVNGIQQLQQFAKSGVLVFAMFQVALLGLSRTALEILRLGTDYKIYRKIKKKYKRFVDEYLKAHESDKLEKKHSNKVWIMWLQGIENAPEVVKCCYQSIEKHLSNSKEIVVITEENYSDYITFPDYIVEKYKKGIITKTHFSDLVRLELLANYGGTWIDGTVLCTNNPYECNMDYMLEDDLFVFQTLKPGKDGHANVMSSWFMTACSNNEIILLTRALLYEYWQKKNYLMDYFLLHHMFQFALEQYPEVWNKVVPFSNSIPHILLLRFFEKYDEEMWNKVQHMTCFHKLSYKFEPSQLEIEGTYYRAIVQK